MADFSATLTEALSRLKRAYRALAGDISPGSEKGAAPGDCNALRAELAEQRRRLETERDAALAEAARVGALLKDLKRHLKALEQRRAK